MEQRASPPSDAHFSIAMLCWQTMVMAMTQLPVMPAYSRKWLRARRWIC